MDFCLFCGNTLISGYNDSRVNGTGMQICLSCRKEKLGITTNKQMADFMLSQNPELNKDEIYKKMNIRESSSQVSGGSLVSKYSVPKLKKTALDKELFSMGKLINESLYSNKKKGKKKIPKVKKQ